MNRQISIFVMNVLFLVSFVSAHSVDAIDREAVSHSALGNIIFSLVIGIGLIYLIIFRTYIEVKNNGKK